MGNDSDQIVIGANGSIHVAPVGTTVPANIAAVWGTGWEDLGYASPDGVTLTDSKSLNTVDVWQSFYPARRNVTSRDLTAKFVLRQWNRTTVSLGFGGGTFTEDGAPGSGHFRYVPPSPETIDDRMLGVEWKDGTKTYRLIIVRGMVTDNVETKIARSDPSDLPITFGILGEDGVDPWYLLTDDPAFAA